MNRTTSSTVPARKDPVIDLNRLPPQPGFEWTRHMLFDIRQRLIRIEDRLAPQEPDQKGLFTVARAALYLGVSTKKIYREIKEGTLKSQGKRSARRIPADSVEAFKLCRATKNNQ